MMKLIDKIRNIKVNSITMIIVLVLMIAGVIGYVINYCFYSPTIINKYIAGLETEPTKTETRKNDKKYVNLLDRDTFLEEINRGANQATEEKDKREYLKMISDNLRYKDTERDENNEIQRFYTPLTCENCEIYKRCKGCNLSSCPKML